MLKRVQSIGVAVTGLLCCGCAATAQSGGGDGGAVPKSITTPDRVETRIGTLEFAEGVPSAATVEKVYDQIDFTYAYRAFMDNMRGVSIHAIREGLRSVGVKDGEVLVSGRSTCSR